MPAMANVMLRSDVDGTSDHTFYPVKDIPFPSWRENVSGLPIAGQGRLEAQNEDLKDGAKRVNLKLIKPIMEIIPAGTVNSAGVQAAPAVADTEWVSVTWRLSPRGTNDTRAELQRMLAQLVSGAGYAVGDLVNPVTSGAHAYRDIGSNRVVPYAIANLLFPGA